MMKLNMPNTADQADITKAPAVVHEASKSEMLSHAETTKNLIR